MTVIPFGGYGNAAQRNQYLAESVLSAPPARLLTMLYDRLLLDLARAEEDQNACNWAVASVQLLHAQAIVTELSTSLKLDTWEGASSLLGIYNYASTALVNANIQRDASLTREVINLLEPLRQTWHEAAAMIPVPNLEHLPTSQLRPPASTRGIRESLFQEGVQILGVG